MHVRLIKGAHRRSLCASAIGAALLVCTTAAPAQEALRSVGGHVGIATPLLTVSKETTSIADNFTLLDPIGIGFSIAPNWSLDFETVVATPVHPTGTTGLVVDPGVVYNWGPVATGLRVAFQINAPANVGLIPLVNKGLVPVGKGMWFVEAAFPTFYSEHQLTFNAVLHTGVGF
jgi:hypothetical protein